MSTIGLRRKVTLPIYLGLQEGVGGFCHTSVTIQGETLEMWLPIMDNRNQAVREPSATQVNNTLMRCLTKNLAMHGLGLYIYAGEDIPRVTDEEIQNTSSTDNRIKIVKKGKGENWKEIVENARKLKQTQSLTWNTIVSS